MTFTDDSQHTVRAMIVKAHGGGHNVWLWVNKQAAEQWRGMTIDRNFPTTKIAMDAVRAWRNKIELKYRVEEYTKAPRFTVQERSKNRWIGGHPFFETRELADAYIRGMTRAYGKVT